MIRPVIAALALAALASACHASHTTESDTMSNAAGNAAAAAGVFADRVAALPAAQREGVFMRAITDAGFSCQKIERSAKHAPISGRPAWVIACDNGNDYVALAIPGDTMQIVPGSPADAPGS